jgi:transposase-like protein
MGQAGSSPPGAHRHNPGCPDCGESANSTIRKFGRTRKGTQRYQCKACNKTFVETKGTLFYGRHHSRETILECLAWLAEGSSLAAIRRVKGIKEDTLLGWLSEATRHAVEIEALLRRNHHLTSAQIHALWALNEERSARLHRHEGPEHREVR